MDAHELTQLQKSYPDSYHLLGEFQKSHNDIFETLSAVMPLEEIHKSGLAGDISGYGTPESESMFKGMDSVMDNISKGMSSKKGEDMTDEEYDEMEKACTAMKGNVDSMEKMMKAYKVKKGLAKKEDDEEKEKGNLTPDIIKSLNDRNESLQSKNDELQKSVENLVGVVEGLSAKIEQIGDSAMPSKAFVGNPAIIEKGVKSDEEGNLSVPLANKEAVGKIFNSAISKAEEGSEIRKSLENDLLNYEIAGSRPSPESAIHIYKSSKVKFVG